MLSGDTTAIVSHRSIWHIWGWDCEQQCLYTPQNNFGTNWFNISWSKSLNCVIHYEGHKIGYLIDQLSSNLWSGDIFGLQETRSKRTKTKIFTFLHFDKIKVVSKQVIFQSGCSKPHAQIPKIILDISNLQYLSIWHNRGCVILENLAKGESQISYTGSRDHFSHILSSKAHQLTQPRLCHFWPICIFEYSKLSPEVLEAFWTHHIVNPMHIDTTAVVS